MTSRLRSAVLGVVTHDRQRIGRRHVPARREIRRRPLGRDREDELDLADIGGEAGAATHADNLTPSNGNRAGRARGAAIDLEGFTLTTESGSDRQNWHHPTGFSHSCYETSMNANAVALLAIFEKKIRLEVPLFQRQYVWNQEEHWEPLWEDIARKFIEHLDGRQDAPVHFLGAMVLDQKQTPITHVEKRQVIDGQQRLTTFQIFLTVLRDFCREHDCEDLAKECESFTLNRRMMVEPDVDKFKVWPTQLDRVQFSDVIIAGSRKALEERHPRVRRKWARRPDPRPRMVEAYIFFYDQLSEFILGKESEKPLAADVPIATRLEECFQALKNSLQVVAIDLDQEDDAQVIFETLNARGAPLLPADLLRNYIFLRAARAGKSQEALYDKYWKRFDDDFWRVEVKQGRLN